MQMGHTGSTKDLWIKRKSRNWDRSSEIHFLWRKHIAFAIWALAAATQTIVIWPSRKPMLKKIQAEKTVATNMGWIVQIHSPHLHRQSSHPWHQAKICDTENKRATISTQRRRIPERHMNNRWTTNCHTPHHPELPHMLLENCLEAVPSHLPCWELRKQGRCRKKDEVVGFFGGDDEHPPLEKKPLPLERKAVT